MMRVLLVGHGRMGQLVERLAPDYGGVVAAVVRAQDAERTLREADFGSVDVAIDFTLADAVPRNLPILAARGVNVVIGTTGWGASEPEMREVVKAEEDQWRKENIGDEWMSGRPVPPALP